MFLISLLLGAIGVFVMLQGTNPVISVALLGFAAVVYMLGTEQAEQHQGLMTAIRDGGRFEDDNDF